MTITLSQNGGLVTMPYILPGFAEFYASSIFIIGNKTYGVEKLPKSKAFLIFLGLRATSHEEDVDPFVQAAFDEKGNKWDSRVTKGLIQYFFWFHAFSPPGMGFK